MTRSPASRPLTAALRRLLAAGTALAAVLTVVSGLSAAPTASAAGSLVEGTVTHVDDGDTLHVKVPGVAQELYIRMTGINAPELTTYANDPSGWVGMCGGVAAARRLHGLVYGKRVQVSAMDNASNSGGRPRRAIAVQIDGAWTDVGGIMVSEGLALYLPSPTEYQYNRDYLRRAQIAAAQGVGLYGRSICGAGPSADANLSVVVQWDAPGDDNANVNGEHIKVVNHGATPVSLGGWWVRDSAERGTKAHPGYRFPAGTSVSPHASVVVRVGKGTSTATTKYWGLASPIFENVTAGPRYMSDGGYLFDPDGDLRAWQLYPCNEFCPVPELKGKVAVTKIVADPAGVDTAAKEYVVLRNVSPQTISLVGYQLRAGAQRWTFRTGSTLRPREQVTVYMGKGRTTRLKQYIGLSRPALANAGGTTMSLDPLGTKFYCRAWGKGRC